MGAFTKQSVSSVSTPGQLWVVTPQPCEEGLLRNLTVIWEGAGGIRSFEEKTRGNLLPSLTGKEHAVSTSILCVVPHKPLFEEMKQPHENNTGQKTQTKWKKKKVGSYWVYRGDRGLTTESSSPVLNVNWILCVSILAGWTPTQWGTRSQVTSIYQQGSQMLIAAEQ